MRKWLVFLFFIFVAYGFTAYAQADEDAFIVGDALPDAPELTPRGEYKVGVRTVEFTNKGQIDILKAKGGTEPLYDRPLKIEIWYPAQIKEEAKELVIYQSTLGRANDPKRPLVPFNFTGRALREATPLTAEGPFPLIIVSHGYPGSRLLLTYLTENLASKGYIVAAIDHTESTYGDLAGFQSTLLHRPTDILFILQTIAGLSQAKSKHFLAGLADATTTALVGYSMGGYGVLNAAGAGFSPQLAAFFGTMTGGSKSIGSRTGNHPGYQATIDKRIKAVVAFAPWGMERGVWDAKGLQGLSVPTLFVAGSQDDISGYEKGIKAIYNGAVNADRYLLTYVNARHNVAPNAPPDILLKPEIHSDEYYHYAEPAWNERRINNINQHVITAFLGIHLKKKDWHHYLQAEENTGSLPGFKPRTSVGIELLHSSPVK